MVLRSVLSCVQYCRGVAFSVVVVVAVVVVVKSCRRRCVSVLRVAANRVAPTVSVTILPILTLHSLSAFNFFLNRSKPRRFGRNPHQSRDQKAELIAKAAFSEAAMSQPAIAANS